MTEHCSYHVTERELKYTVPYWIILQVSSVILKSVLESSEQQ